MMAPVLGSNHNNQCEVLLDPARVECTAEFFPFSREQMGTITTKGAKGGRKPVVLLLLQVSRSSFLLSSKTLGSKWDVLGHTSGKINRPLN